MILKRQHIGLGPMGMAVFYAAHNMGDSMLERLLEGGVALIDKASACIGSGQFHFLAIRTISDPLDAIRFIPTSSPFYRSPESKQARKVLEGMSNRENCSFVDLAKYYHATANELIDCVKQRSDGSRFIESTVDYIVYDSTLGTFTSFDRHNTLLAKSQEIVIATGGTERLHTDLLPFKNAVTVSQNILAHDKQAIITQLQHARKANQMTIVIVGSGNSAIGALGELMKLDEAKGFQVIIAHRSKLYPYYESVEDAASHGYHPNKDELSRMKPFSVNRVRGLRHTSQKILLDSPNSNLQSVSFLKFSGNLKELEVIKKAGLIIQAIGYQGVMPRLIDKQHRIIPVLLEKGRAVVDGQDRLLRSDGTPILGAYRVGMGAMKHNNWQAPGYDVERAIVSGPIDGLKAFQGPHGAGEKLVSQLIGELVQV